MLLKTPDLDAALGFFGEAMGFGIAALEARSGWARLASNVPVYLEACEGRRHPQNVASAKLTFQTQNLDTAIGNLRSGGAELTSAAPHQVAVGRTVRFADPAGIIHSMLQPSHPTPAFGEPKVYNSGFHLPQSSIAPTRALLERALGFAAMTERYYPPSIPYLEADGSFAFMLHHNQPIEEDLLAREGARNSDLGAWEVFTASDLRSAIREAAAGGAIALDTRPRQFEWGRRVAFTTPGGAPFEIWSWS